jgi:membrane protein DedA with SNARE-associated domain/rhodanese-related sulfurtransferase
LTQQLLSHISQYGLLLVALNVFLNQIGLPVPVVPTLILAGTLAAKGDLPFFELFAIATAACLIADCAWYWVGEKYGIRVLKTICKISLEPDSCVSQTQSQFDRWGINSLVVAKFVPGWSTIAPPLAGALRIGWLRFIALSLLAAMLWVGVGLLGGMIFKTQVEQIVIRLDRFGGAALAGALLLLAGYIAYKWWERRRFYSALRMARISVTELRELLDSGAAPLIVDVRSPGATALEFRRIPGALNVPLDQVGKHVKDLPRDRDLILYCTCPNEASAAQAAKLLKNHGFSRVRPLHGGLDAWVAAGYAVEPLTLVTVDDVTARPV